MGLAAGEERNIVFNARTQGSSRNCHHLPAASTCCSTLATRSIRAARHSVGIIVNFLAIDTAWCSLP